MTRPHRIGPAAAVALGAALVTLAACSGPNAFSSILSVTGSRTSSSVASVQVSPDTVRFDALDQTSQLTAVAVDSVGNQVTDAPMRWGSSDPTVAVVDQVGLVTSIGSGQATITATSGNASGTAFVTVTTTGALPVGGSPRP